MVSQWQAPMSEVQVFSSSAWFGAQTGQLFLLAWWLFTSWRLYCALCDAHLGSGWTSNPWAAQLFGSVSASLAISKKHATRTGVGQLSQCQSRASCPACHSRAPRTRAWAMITEHLAARGTWSRSMRAACGLTHNRSSVAIGARLELVGKGVHAVQLRQPSRIPPMRGPHVSGEETIIIWSDVGKSMTQMSRCPFQAASFLQACFDLRLASYFLNSEDPTPASAAHCGFEPISLVIYWEPDL